MEEQNGRRVIRHSEPVVSKDTTEIDLAARKPLIKKWIKRGLKILIIILIFLYLRNTYKLLNQYNNFYFSSLKGFPTNFHCGIDLDEDNAVDYKNTHLAYVDSEWNDDTAVFNLKFTNNGDDTVSFNEIYSVVGIDPDKYFSDTTVGTELNFIGGYVFGDKSLSKSTHYDGQTNVQYDVPSGETIDVHVCFDISDIDNIDNARVGMIVKPKYYFALLLQGNCENLANRGHIESLGNGGHPQSE